MTFATVAVMRTRAFTYSKIRSDDGDFADADMLILINGALQHLSTKHEWPWLYAEDTISAVVGTRDYAVPTGWTKTAWLSIESTGVFQALTMKEMQRWNATDLKAKPRYFSHVGDTSVRIAPFPDKSYTIDIGFYKAETVMTGDSDTPLFDDAYEDYVIWELVKRMGLRKGDNDMVRMAKAELKDWEKDIADNVQRSKDIPRVRVRNDYSMGI